MDKTKITKNQSFPRRMGFALRGLRHAVKQESSFRIQLACALLVLGFCVLTKPPLFWSALFAFCCALVLSLELVNTAFEALLDHLHPHEAPAIGLAKDCLAGAVFIASLGSGLVFLAYLATLLS